MTTFTQHQNQKINLLLASLLSISLGYCLVKLQIPKLQEVRDVNLGTDEYLKQAKAEELELSVLNKAPNFGLSNFVASHSYIKFLIYMGDENARRKTGYSLSPKYLEVIAENDPLFSKAFVNLSAASSIYGGAPEKTVEIMDQVLEKLTPDFPQAYLVWLYKGVDEVLFMGDLKKAQHSYEKAAEWANIAGDQFIENAARNTAEFLTTNPDIVEAQVGAWYVVLTSTSDKIVRQAAIRNIEQLGGTIEVFPDGRVVVTAPKSSN
ncbi:hypothetical protein Xen7305DRAFT_00010360 [Xenococcus sp. PCC 7305]|uniref:hypothetical protein n=1 Tax=Xenococcus sp. PCC 7305 TaxID=102125 RepID=UPI0002AC1489|nr:hypothetical protein [Xenococcus sp. PCC 7305]ELS01333.1 hypothetical protein Xen7305DRAFT_00010360 [Xenococcus sp. PCC 7305]